MNRNSHTNPKYYALAYVDHGHLCFTMKITLVKGYYLMIF
jgi:uncharacterized protein (DUF488 family)